MLRFLRLSLAAAALSAIASISAWAQSPCPSPNATQFSASLPYVCANTEGSKASYSAVATGLVPPASATDVACIAGSATTTVRITRISISGTAGTLVTLPVFLAKRASVDTGGTAATGNALPVAGKHDSTEPASGATLVSYTAVPTITDTSPALIRAGTITLPVTSAGTVNGKLEWTFSDRNERAIVLRGVAQQLCVNLSSISVSSGVLAIDFEWGEDNS